jgi:hypothetical protein
MKGVTERGRGAHVPGDARELVKLDGHGIVRLDVLRQAVDHLFALGLEGSEESVPHDEDAGVIAVDVLRIRPVVDAVVRRGVHDPLDRAHAADRLGVNPVLVEQAERAHQRDQLGPEAEERQRHPEHHSEERRRPRLPQGRAQRVPLTRVVDDVPRPEEADFVAHAVIPVVTEVFGRDEQQPRQRPGAEVEEAILVEPGERGEPGAFDAGLHHQTAEPARQAGGGVLGLVAVSAAGQHERLDGEAGQEEGNREDGGLFHDVFPLRMRGRAAGNKVRAMDSN